MVAKQNPKEIIDSALDVWRSTGQDLAGGIDLTSLQRDPVVRLLLGAIVHQSELIQEEAESLRSSLLDDFLRVATPAALSLVTPAVGMIQVAKGVSAGSTNQEPTILDENIVFQVSAPGQSQPRGVPFMPVLRTRVADAKVVDVEQVASGRWRVVIDENESLGTLEGLSLLIKGVPGNAAIRITSGGTAIPFATLQDIGSLPFVSPLTSIVEAEGYTAQFRMLQEMMDGFCLSDNTYCVLRGMRSTQPHRSNGRLHLELELPSTVRLTSEEVLLGCVPVVNLAMTNVQLSRERPIAKVDEKNGRFFALTTSAAEVRHVGTERLNAREWSQRLDRLIAQFEENYNVFSNEMDSRMSAALQQLLPAISDIKSETSSTPVYIVLSDPLVSGLDAGCLLSLGSQANGLDENASIECNSAEVDVAHTKIVATTMGGRDETEMTAEIKSHQQYFVRTGDRIVTRADMGHFCRQMLARHFGIASERVIELSITPSIVNNQQGFYERYTLVEIRISAIDKNEPRRIASALERLMASRLANLSPVRIVITPA